MLFAAPQLEFEHIRSDWLREVEELAGRGVFVGGAAVAGFEEAFARYLGTSYAVGVGNGTDALTLAMRALGIGPGDEVIAPANTFVATVEAIHHTGARPVLVDCRPDTLLLDPDRVREAVTARTKAVAAVHLYGRMIELGELAPWLAERGIALVEDCAQAAGARLRGRSAGSWGAVGCYSFYPDKNLGALGDGGCVATDDAGLAAAVRKLRNHGGETRYRHETPGFNSRLDAIQALALRLKLDRLDGWNAHRLRVAAWYDETLAGIDGLRRPELVTDGSHVYHLYVVRIGGGRRDEVKKGLQKKGILTAVQYPVPVHLTPAFAGLGHAAGDFPAAEAAAGELLSLPMHIGMTERDAATVADAIRELLGASAAEDRVGSEASGG